VENNSVYSGNGPGNGGNARGYDVRNSSGVIVQNNTYHTPTSTTSQTDAAWSSGNNGVIFQNNEFTIENSNSYGHSDGVQSYQDVNVTIRGNWISHPNGGLNNHGMWLEDASGTVNVFNNIVFMPVGDEQGIAYVNQGGGTGKALMYNNTVYGSLWGYGIDSSPNSEIKNNVAIGAAGKTGIQIEGRPPPAQNIDYNLISVPNGTIADVNGQPKTWTQWKSLGFGARGINAPPQFVSSNPKSPADFQLSSTSPAVNHGYNISSVGVDYMSVLRPQGGVYDIGAYERVGRI